MKQQPIWALGLMSGTSLDGVDAALLKTDGIEIAAFGPGAERPYQPSEIAAVEAVMTNWQAHRPVSAATSATLLQAEADVVRAHAVAVAALLSDTSEAP